MIPPFLSLSFHDVEEGKFSLSFHICVLSLNVFSSDIHSLFTQILVCLFTTLRNKLLTLWGDIMLLRLVGHLLCSEYRPKQESTSVKPWPNVRIRSPCSISASGPAYSVPLSSLVDR